MSASWYWLLAGQPQFFILQLGEQASFHGQAAVQEGQGQKWQDLLRPALCKSQNDSFTKSYRSKQVSRPAQIQG